MTDVLLGIAIALVGAGSLINAYQIRQMKMTPPTAVPTTLVDKAAGYFGPAQPKAPKDAADLGELVAYVNRTDEGLPEPGMFDPNDEMRIGTGYAGT